MKNLLLLLVIGLNIGNAQPIDYNTKKGYVAKGYDVVSYFDHMAEEGNSEFTATYDGVKYKFISQEHKNTFLKHPEKYIPQYGGYCAYAIADKGKKVDINPETFEIRDGKLYLFYNAWGTNTLELWLKDVKGLQQKADQHWEAIKKRN